MKAAGAGFGEDLNLSVDGVGVVLGGVGILVDADLADGVPWRKGSIREPVHVEVRVGPSREGGELLLQLARVERQLVNGVTLKDYGVAVLGWVGAVGGVEWDVDLLRFDLDFELQVEVKGFVGRGGEAGGKWGEALGLGGECSLGAGLYLQSVASVAAGLHGAIGSALWMQGDDGLRDQGAGRISDDAADGDGLLGGHTALRESKQEEDEECAKHGEKTGGISQQWHGRNRKLRSNDCEGGIFTQRGVDFDGFSVPDDPSFRAWSEDSVRR